MDLDYPACLSLGFDPSDIVDLIALPLGFDSTLSSVSLAAPSLDFFQPHNSTPHLALVDATLGFEKDLLDW